MTDAHSRGDHGHPHPHASRQEHTHAHGHPHGAGLAGVLFIEATAVLCVASVAASLDYYRRVLGFGLDFAWSDETQFAGGGPLTFAQVSRGECRLMLSQQSQGAPGMWVHLDLATADEMEILYGEYQRSGARIIEPPSNRPWNRREMRVEDPDGHTFRISSPFQD